MNFSSLRHQFYVYSYPLVSLNARAGSKLSYFTKLTSYLVWEKINKSHTLNLRIILYYFTHIQINLSAKWPEPGCTFLLLLSIRKSRRNNLREGTLGGGGEREEKKRKRRKKKAIPLILPIPVFLLTTNARTA